MGEKVDEGTKLSDAMQKSGDELQKVFGKAGDPAASDLMQEAKIFAGEVGTASRVAGKDKEKLDETKGKAGDIENFKKPAELEKAEDLIENIEELIADSVVSTKNLDDTIELATGGNNTEGAAEQYFPIMYFIEPKKQDFPSTCGGELIKKPIVSDSMDGCASACDDAETSDGCVGFAYFKVGDEEPLCFLMSKFKSAVYYSDCGSEEEESASFLQAKKQHSKKRADVTCFAKFSTFSGTTLKPDRSGKCKQCLKKVTDASRCYK
eukprot:gnl/TRDRNA2_/TRDRNA2_177906_c2_seq1.p1 gnl/TRDRNA2_/TRDRNA2_177906_c2~~gnl/TRDRNA2_/TRDRNA2_177906_c2_seq1.p1  ORF type:complete len:283 (-),score=98.21 gnl/TRDRNA2_/TRDRNA2_177906_c2_seq1:73-867(-)